MARILISGAAGFIGSHLSERLVREGNEVYGVDNFITGSPENLESLRSKPAFHLLKEDVSVPGWTMAGPFDEIMHLASLASPRDYYARPLETLESGSTATKNLLEIARRDNARFLVTSTSEVYGDPLVHPQREDYWGNVNPIGIRSCYDESKRYAEAITMAYHRQFGLATRIARIFNTYGPRMQMHDGRVVPEFIGQALAGQPLTVYGDGKQTRSFCYVSDMVEGLIRLLRSGVPEPVNLGNPDERTILDFAHAIQETTGTKSEIEYRPLPQDDPKRRRPDITRARTLLGWEPKVSLPEGIKLTIEYFAALQRV